MTTPSIDTSGTTIGTYLRRADTTKVAKAKGYYQGRTASKAETSCFVNIKNKIKDFFKAVKRLASRAIEKVKDALRFVETAIIESSKEIYDKVKDFKTPFRKNYFDIKLGKHHLKADRPATVGELFSNK